jgi:hypothetical protein
MKRIIHTLAFTIFSVTLFYAQMNQLADPALNEVVQTPAVVQNIGETATICVTVTNAGVEPIPADKILVTLSWSSIYDFQGDNNVVAQGWTIIQSSPQAATFRNTTDDIDPILETKDLCIDVIAVAIGDVNSNLILAQIQRAPGAASMVGNAQTGNDNVANGQGVLPVEFTSFAGKVIDCQTQLTWSTASEINNDRFEVQHSTDAKKFTSLTKVKGAGTTVETQQYSFIHQEVALGTNYYRLKQVDTDGTTDYSEMIAVDNTCEYKGDIFSIFPNPVGGEELTISYEVQQSHEAEIEVLDVSGKLILRNRVAAELGENRFSLRTAALAPGTYYISIYKEGRRVQTERLVKMTE